jgi:AI-2 transport protein TqsA
MSHDGAASTLPPEPPDHPNISPDIDRPKRELLSGPTRLLLPLALAVIVIFGMKYAASILNPIFFALFLTMGVSPALYWLRRRGVPSWLCVAIVMVVTVILVLLFVLVMLSAVSQLNDKLPSYQENLGKMTASIQTWFSAHDIDIGGLTSKTLSPGNILSAAKTLLSSLAGIFGNLFWLILIFIFMLAEAYTVPAKIDNIHMDRRFAHSFVNFVDVTKSFLFTKGWLSAVMAVICTIIYWGFGIDFALVWGILYFLLSFVPNIGFVLAVVPPFVVSLLQFGITRAVIVLVVVIVANSVLDNLISPRIMGRSVGLSSLTILLSLLFWSWVLGGLGALMAVPLTLMVKLLFFDSFDSTRVISEIMATPVRQMGKRKRSRNGEDKAIAK